MHPYIYVYVFGYTQFKHNRCVKSRSTKLCLLDPLLVGTPGLVGSPTKNRGRVVMGKLSCGVGKLFGHRFEDISVNRTETLTFHTYDMSSLFWRSIVCAFFLEIMIICRIIISCKYLSVVNFSNWHLFYFFENFVSQNRRMSDPIAFSVFLRSDVYVFKITKHV